MRRGCYGKGASMSRKKTLKAERLKRQDSEREMENRWTRPNAQAGAIFNCQAINALCGETRRVE